MFILLSALAATSVAQQLAPAKRGLPECQMPNLESKTCFTLSKVTQLTPSTYAFDTELLLDAAGMITARIHSQVFVSGSEICERMSGRDAASATFASEGRPLSGPEAAEYRAKLRGQFAPIAGHIVCTRNIPADDGLETVIGTIDGKRVPQGDYGMKWVDPRDGWKVGP
jgi:hypothetical protein